MYTSCFVPLVLVYKCKVLNRRAPLCKVKQQKDIFTSRLRRESMLEPKIGAYLVQPRYIHFRNKSYSRTAAARSNKPRHGCPTLKTVWSSEDIKIILGRCERYKGRIYHWLALSGRCSGVRSNDKVVVVTTRNFLWKRTYQDRMCNPKYSTRRERQARSLKPV
jgi:hypothetical protein